MGLNRLFNKILDRQETIVSDRKGITVKAALKVARQHSDGQVYWQSLDQWQLRFPVGELITMLEEMPGDEIVLSEERNPLVAIWKIVTDGQHHIGFKFDDMLVWD